MLDFDNPMVLTMLMGMGNEKKGDEKKKDLNSMLPLILLTEKSTSISIKMKETEERIEQFLEKEKGAIDELNAKLNNLIDKFNGETDA